MLAHRVRLMVRGSAQDPRTTWNTPRRSQTTLSSGPWRRRAARWPERVAPGLVTELETAERRNTTFVRLELWPTNYSEVGGSATFAKQLHEPGQARTTGPAGTPTRSISPKSTKALAKIRNIPTHPKVKPPDRQDHEHRHLEHAYAHEQEENDKATPEKIE